MAQRWRFGIFPKVLLTMVVVAVIPLGAIWYVDYRSSVQRLSSQVDQQLADRAEAVLSYVDAWVDMNVKMLQQNAALDDIVSMDAKRQRRTLLTITNECKAVYLAFTIAPDGTNIGRSDLDSPKNYGDRIYVQQVLHGPRWASRSSSAAPTDSPPSSCPCPSWPSSGWAAYSPSA